jgi:hypothetical protein
MQPNAFAPSIALIMFFCGCNGTSVERGGNPAFDVTANSVIYLTDQDGTLNRLTTDGEITEILKKRGEFFESVSVSGDEKVVAVSAVSHDPSLEPVVTVHYVDLKTRIEISNVATFPGRFPVVSDDGTLLVYCRPKRFAKGSRFGGNLWTDYQLWLYDTKTKEHSLLSDEKYFAINGIAINRYASEITFSGTPSGETHVIEQLFTLALADKPSIPRLFSTSRCRESTPRYSHDDSKILLVTDERRSFHYEVSSVDRKSKARQFLTDGKSIRYVTQPVSDAQGSIFFLGATKFSLDGRPILHLFKRDKDGAINEVHPKNDTLSDNDRPPER